ncbi:hypothetical protein PsYK624_131760 [Phanerochaete sordida]|uniref:F-box domain-containing protein n=1 Tax=Phanerochaete sordida TaxID=48140 RepID=A0A9P3GL30_9APHY|nr:hypothetical protein PsYK624_131760 [Phanerochaete sordida]
MNHLRRYSDIRSELELEEAIASRNQRIETLHLEVCDLKTQRNAVAARISRLPVETLAQIFKELQTTEREKHPFRWIVVTHVSRHWRSVALGSANLWNLIRYTPMRNDRARAFMQRSGQTPLRIVCVQDHDLSPSTFLSKVAQEAHRIRSVDLSTKHPNAALLEELPVWNATRLEHISVRINGYHDELPDRPDLAFLSAADLPVLKYLHLEGLGAAGFKAFLRPTVTHLVIHTGGRDLVVPLWVRLVRELTLLEQLDLAGPFALDEHSIPPVSDTVSLPRLANVTLRDTSRTGYSMAFLEHLVHPVGCRISLRTIGYDLEHMESIRQSIAVVGSRLKCGGSMQSCRLRREDTLSLELWRSVIDFEDNGGASIPEPDFRVVSPRTYYHGDSQAFRELVALLPGADVQRMYYRRGKEMADDELLDLFPGVAALVFKCTRPAGFLSRLARRSRGGAMVPLLFPALRSLTLHGARWHEHDASCLQPYSDSSLATLVEVLLTARAAMGVALDELHLHDLRNVEEPYDHPDIEAFSAKVAAFSWSSAPLDGVVDSDGDHSGQDDCQLCLIDAGLHHQIFGSDTELSDAETWDNASVDSDME